MSAAPVDAACLGERFFEQPERVTRFAIALLASVTLIAVRLAATSPVRPSTTSPSVDTTSTTMTRLALGFNVLGRGIGRTVSLVAIAAMLLRPGRRRALGAFAAAEALAPLASTMLKLVVDRPRPSGGLLTPHGSSFPSGHAAYAGTTFVALVLVCTKPQRRRRRWWAAVALGVAGMAWSRTRLGVHRPVDVTAGSLLGVGVSLLVFARAQRRN